MEQFFVELANTYMAAPDRVKKFPRLAFSCKVVSEHQLLGRAIGNVEYEHCIGKLYACTKHGRGFVYVRTLDQIQGFVTETEPIKIVTLSELGALPYPASIDVFSQENKPLRLIESIGARGDGTSHWLVEPRWSETMSWIIQHST